MRLQQPDRRSCGAAALVMARRLVRPHYAGLVTDQSTFAHEAATLHRRLTSLSDTASRWQVPWPRALGTPPWAVARELGGRVRRYRRGEVVAALPGVVPVYLGSRWLPRHVVLALDVRDGEPVVYDPARGALTPISSSRWRARWWAILPG